MLGDAELAGDLLGGQVTVDQQQALALARRQPLDQVLRLCLSLAHKADGCTGLFLTSTANNRRGRVLYLAITPDVFAS
jgi:hypothetical protein